ncbi:Oidioi.mRNA.OKI2018_I69.chr2.g7626.t2.cds [Oikopleura dioica]|uniref:Oidioi.mRNA.OKI2018_I69.chr2.g7626.t2.cds n=1 Tax=Oikopleura dioica TaxID=34765 RepID=A0ABN7TDC5_OIKDI|nr:Oidioi.mRNA.OKI2018_I69.chr2.g7626.t2.cds [Oikopleura dioica]
MPGATGTSVAEMERHVNELSDEVKQEVSAVINASARQSIRPYNTQNEYLFAMKEDLSEWLQILHSETINAYSFFRKLETGILLCKHANTVTLHAEEFKMTNPEHPSLTKVKVPQNCVKFNEGRHVKAESFFARDNVAVFIKWCREELGISDIIMFETDDLILRKNEKNFILTLLEVARRGAKFGMEAPTIVKLEQEIEREMRIDAGEVESDYSDYEEPEPEPQKVAIDFKSLDEMVQYYLGLCTCPTMFSLTKVGDGKYRIGDSKALIYMRILRNHVMVRVGGGWDTLENYLNKHDPCRCQRHRQEKHIRQKLSGSTTRLNQTLSPQATTSSKSSSRRGSRASLAATLSTSTPSLNASRPADSTRKGKFKSKSVTNLIEASFGVSPSSSVFDRLYSNSNRRTRSPKTETPEKEHFIIERHEKGHVVKEVKGTPSSVKSDIAKERRRTTNNSNTPTRSPATARRNVNLNQSLPVDRSSVERSRPLKGDSNSASRMKKHRSQTPSRSRIGSSTPPRSSSATPYSTPMTAKTPRTKRLTSQESMAPGKSSGKTSRESSQDRKVNMKVYRDDRLTLEDLGSSTKDEKAPTKRPKSAAEMALQSLSVSLHGVSGELVKPRMEARPGSARSRIPVPVGRRVNTRSPSPFFSNESPERADSGIDIYNDFESPTNTMRRQRAAEATRPPDIIE